MFEETRLEKLAISKCWKKGKCKKTVFADGGHRVGMIPTYSVLDGGLPGDVAQEICLHCEKVFKKSCFYPRKQPNKI